MAASTSFTKPARAAAAAGRHRLELIDSIEGGRITFFDEGAGPSPHRAYVLGVDFAYGLEGRDFDAGILLDNLGQQIATVQGHWGESFGEILEPLVDWFDPFIVGERTATGLPILRKFHQQARWLYYQRDENTKGRPVRDVLGHAPGQMDLTIAWLRKKLSPRDPTTGELQRQRVLTVRDPELHTQLCRYQFQSKSQRVATEDARDAQLKMGAPTGEHDDLVRAFALASAGLEWLPHYEPPRPKFAPGTFGHLLKYDQPDEPKPNPADRWRKR